MRRPALSLMLIVEPDSTKEPSMIDTESTRPLSRALSAAVLLSAALMATYYYGGVAGQADDTPLRASLVGSVGAVLAGLLAWRAARGVFAGAADDRLARRTVVLAAAAVISLAGFWLGMTVPVCVAAAALGLKTALAGRRVLGYATVGVAALVCCGALVLSVLGSS
jgi:hypothetical protein